MKKIIEPYPECDKDFYTKDGLYEEQLLDTVLLSIYGNHDIPSDCEKYDAVRVFNPSETIIDKYAGVYTLKPSILFWYLETPLSIDEYLTKLSHNYKLLLKKSLIYEKNKLNLFVENYINKERLDDFYCLYREQITKIKNGIDVASQDYHEFISNPEKYAGIYIYENNELLAGMLIIKHFNKNTIRAVYMADRKHKKISTSRLLYYHLIEYGIQHNYDYISLGCDPNLYGHIVSVGLLLFKTLAGFKVCDANNFGIDSPKVLEKINKRDKFGDVLIEFYYDDNNNLKRRTIE